MNGFAADHRLAEVRVSPNFGPRRGVDKADCIILHYTGMESGAAAEAWLCDPVSEVSSHYLVHEDGRVVQMVRESDRAWHAGRSSWDGATDMNSLSIGVEIVNAGHPCNCPAFPERQIAAVARLCRDICARLRITAHRVLAHSDIAPGRKCDPGEHFPWDALAAAGVGHYVDPVPVSSDEGLSVGAAGEAVERLQTMLSIYGYDIGITGVFDARTRIVVEAFQRHFRRGRVDGVADSSTVETLRRLIARLP